MRLWLKPTIVNDEPLGYIYYITSVEPDYPVKIGYSSTIRGVSDRVKTLQTGNPYNLYTIGWKRGAYSDERDEHERWNHLRLRGEWFMRRRELALHIKRSKEIRVVAECPTN